VPDAKVAWKDVWFGAVVTALLFTAGKFALGLYLGKSSVVSTYAAAGALLIVLLWVYYTSQIVFYGAELTQAYARARGREVAPASYAERDEAKAQQAEAHARDRERKKTAKGKPSDSLDVHPEPVYAMQTGDKRFTGKTFGILLLLLALVPFEKKLFRNSKS
jgi:membrane protein